VDKTPRRPKRSPTAQRHAATVEGQLRLGQLDGLVLGYIMVSDLGVRAHRIGESPEVS
jgi:hypothetical protein